MGRLFGPRKVQRLPRRGVRTAGAFDPDSKNMEDYDEIVADSVRALGFYAVPESHRFVVEKDGRFSRLLFPGKHRLAHGERIAYVHSLAVKTLRIDDGFLTADREEIGVTAHVMLRVEDPLQASYAVEDPLKAILFVAMSTLREQIIRLPVEVAFDESEVLGYNTMLAINHQSRAWGWRCVRVMLDVAPSMDIREQMHVQGQLRRQTMVQYEEQTRRHQLAAANQDAALRAQERAMYSEEVCMIHESQAVAEAQVAVASAEARIVREIADLLAEPGGEAAFMIRAQQKEFAAATGGMGGRGMGPGGPGGPGGPPGAFPLDPSLHSEILSQQREAQMHAAASMHSGMPPPGAMDPRNLPPHMRPDVAAVVGMRQAMMEGGSLRPHMRPVVAAEMMEQESMGHAGMGPGGGFDDGSMRPSMGSGLPGGY